MIEKTINNRIVADVLNEKLQNDFNRESYESLFRDARRSGEVLS